MSKKQSKKDSSLFPQNGLPELPRVLDQKETKFSEVFRKWIMANPRMSSTYELKDTRGKNYFSFSELKEEQENYAKAISGDKGVLIRVQGMNGEPDYNYYRNAPAFIAIRYPKGFVLVTIGNLLHEKERKNNSLTWDRAQDIATKVIHFHKADKYANI